MPNGDHAETTQREFMSVTPDAVVQPTSLTNRLVGCKWILVEDDEIIIRCTKGKTTIPI